MYGMNNKEERRNLSSGIFSRSCVVLRWVGMELKAFLCHCSYYCPTAGRSNREPEQQDVTGLTEGLDNTNISEWFRLMCTAL
jgi:hypothetical protein